MLCSLISTYCVPILLYNAEALSWNKKELKSIEHAYSHGFSKIFKTFNETIIRECQFFMGYMSIEYILLERKLNFLTKINGTKMPLMVRLLRQTDGEQVSLCEQYNIKFDERVGWKKKVWDCKVMLMSSNMLIFIFKLWHCIDWFCSLDFWQYVYFNFVFHLFIFCRWFDYTNLLCE